MGESKELQGHLEDILKVGEHITDEEDLSLHHRSITRFRFLICMTASDAICDKLDTPNSLTASWKA